MLNKFVVMIDDNNASHPYYRYLSTKSTAIDAAKDAINRDGRWDSDSDEDDCENVTIFVTMLQKGQDPFFVDKPTNESSKFKLYDIIRSMGRL